MLMMIGPVRLSVTPFNATEVGHSHSASYVTKPVIGARQPVEWVGEGVEKWTVRAKLFPYRFGGLDALELLRQSRASGLPQYMMRGDGFLMGWVVIETVNERSSYLGPTGVGKVIDVDITLRRCQAPDAGSYFAIMEGLFR